jgi:hypothetical protein
VAGIENLVTRAAWRARQARSIQRLEPAAVRFLVVHYSAMHADEQAAHRNCAARVHGIQAFHMDTRGWNDVAYNWLVCKHGYVFRGRGWEVRSAATGPANGFSVAVCFLGDDVAGRDDVTELGRDAIRSVLAFVTRNAPAFEGVRGHRDFMQTTCPGDELYHFAHSLSAG